MHRSDVRSLYFILAVFLSSSVYGDKHWPQFRGLSGDGKAIEAKLPSEVTEKDVAWKVEIDGKVGRPPWYGVTRFGLRRPPRTVRKCP